MLATRPGTDTIAITRTFDGIEAATHRVITQAGSMASVIKDAKIAVLKPNFVAGRSAETGSTTSFALLKAVAEEVHACGAEPVLCETPVSTRRGANRIGSNCDLRVRSACAASAFPVSCKKFASLTYRYSKRMSSRL